MLSEFAEAGTGGKLHVAQNSGALFSYFFCLKIVWAVILLLCWPQDNTAISGACNSESLLKSWMQIQKRNQQTKN